MEPIDQLVEDPTTEPKPRGQQSPERPQSPEDWAVLYDCPRDWLRANMVASVDGAATIDGRVGDLTGSADQDLLIALRMMSDAVLVGAGTVRAEGYGPIEVADRWAAHRRQAGLVPVPPLVIVSNSGRLDPSAPAFTEAEVGPIVVVPQNCPRLADLRGHGEVITAGSDTVDLTAALIALRERGYRRVLSEGGPRLLGDLVAADLLDELCLAISPKLVGGISGIAPRAASGTPAIKELQLASARQHDGYLFLRYLTQR